MTAIHRRSVRSPIACQIVLASAADVDGTVADNNGLSQSYDITGAARVIIVQSLDTAGDGTAGVDVVEISHDGGAHWFADTQTGLLASANDGTGAVLALGALNAAGVEALAAAAITKWGPYDGPTAIRVGRKTTSLTGLTEWPVTSTSGTTWVTHAPGVIGIVVGLGSGTIAPLGT